MIVRLDSSEKALRPCRYCGGGNGRLTEKTETHNHGVRCASCERHIGWLPKHWPYDGEDDDFDVIEE